MPAWTLFPRANTACRRHVPPATVPKLNSPTFDLMTRSAFVPQESAEPKQITNRPDARRIGKSVGPSRSAVRPKATTTPALRPEHKMGTIGGATPDHRQTRKRLPPNVDGGPDGRTMSQRFRGVASLTCNALRTTLSSSRHGMPERSAHTMSINTRRSSTRNTPLACSAATAKPTAIRSLSGRHVAKLRASTNLHHISARSGIF